MLNNLTRRQVLEGVKASGYEGSIVDVFRQVGMGIPLETILQPQQPLVAETPQEQETGLREQHAQGNIGASMVFPNVQPNTAFNTQGMKVPMNIEKFDNQGHLVKSYKNVPPGIQNLPTGPSEGTVIESPAQYQKGGVKNVLKNIFKKDKTKKEQPVFNVTDYSNWRTWQLSNAQQYGWDSNTLDLSKDTYIKHIQENPEDLWKPVPYYRENKQKGGFMQNGGEANIKDMPGYDPNTPLIDYTVNSPEFRKAYYDPNILMYDAETGQQRPELLEGTTVTAKRNTGPRSQEYMDFIQSAQIGARGLRTGENITDKQREDALYLQEVDPVKFGMYQGSDFTDQMQTFMKGAAVAPLVPIVGPTISKVGSTSLLPGVSGTSAFDALGYYGAYHGAKNLPGDIKSFVQDPSLQTAGDVGLDLLGMGVGAYSTTNLLKNINTRGRGFSKELDKIVSANTPKSTVRTPSPNIQYTPEASLLKSVPNPKNIKLQSTPSQVHRTVYDRSKFGTVDADYSRGIHLSGAPITTTKRAWDTALDVHPGVFQHTSRYNVGMSTTPNLSHAQNLYAYRGVGGGKLGEMYSEAKGSLHPKFKSVPKWNISYNVNPSANILDVDRTQKVINKAYELFPRTPVSYQNIKGQLHPQFTKTIDFTTGKPINVPHTRLLVNQALQERGYQGVRKWGDNPEIQWLNPAKSLTRTNIEFVPNLQEGGFADKARQVRMMRPPVGEYVEGQPEGTVSTHLMKTYEQDGKYYVVPSITHKKAPYSGYTKQSFEEALAKGEAIEFDTQEEADSFAKGSWKLPTVTKQFRKGGLTIKQKTAIGRLRKYELKNGGFVKWGKEYIKKGGFKKKLMCK